MDKKEGKIIKTIQIEQSMFDEIAEYAKREARSVNNMIKVLLHAALEAKRQE